MTAWVKKGTQEVVGVITDYTDNTYAPVLFFLPDGSPNETLRLTEYNKKLIDAYLDIPYKETKCGYACSDQ